MTDEQIIELWRTTTHSPLLPEHHEVIAFARALADKDAQRDAERWRAYWRKLKSGKAFDWTDADDLRKSLDAEIARSSPTEGERK